MEIDIIGPLIQGILSGIGALFVGIWEASLQHPWIPLVIAGAIALACIAPRSSKRRRYGYR